MSAEISQSTYEHPHSFEEAKQYLTQPDCFIDYEVKFTAERPMPNGTGLFTFQGALMTRDSWLEQVADHSFIDYDGMGHQFTEDGKLIPLKDVLGSWIKPSQAGQIDPKCAYILWYNR